MTKTQCVHYANKKANGFLHSLKCDYLNFYFRCKLPSLNLGR